MSELWEEGRSTEISVAPLRMLFIGEDQNVFQWLRTFCEKDLEQPVLLTFCDKVELGVAEWETGAYEIGVVDYDVVGDTCLQLLREASEGSHFRAVIVLTKEPQAELAESLFDAGASELLEGTEAQRPKLEHSLHGIWEKYCLTEELKENDAVMENIALGAKDGLWDWSLKTGDIKYSSRWKAMLGYRDDEIDGHIQEWFQRLFPEDATFVESSLGSFLESTEDVWETEYRIRHKNDSFVWMRSRGVAIRDTEGQVVRISGWQMDLRERAATHDVLTHLPNRKLFLERLESAIAKNQRDPDFNYAVVYIDLDHFKMVNDSLGHGAGDMLLVEVSSRLKKSLRSFDTVAYMDPEREALADWSGKTQSDVKESLVARFGGDEFAVLLEDVSLPRDAVVVAQRLRDDLSSAFEVEGHEVFSSASLGVAHSKTKYTNSSDILRDADIAMYRSKEKGKSECTLFDTQMHEEVKARLALETDLRRALEREELSLYYQPVVSMKNGAILGFEALLRWNRKQASFVSPSEFIPIAEDMGLIASMGGWVLEKACRQLNAWHEMFHSSLTMSVNVSGRELIQPNWVESVEAILTLTGLDPKSLRLEVTESSFLESKKFAVDSLNRLRLMGIQIQMDDFGTGYSSLSRLHLLPLDTLKIDRSFVQHMGGQKSRSGIVKAILTLAQDLQLGVIAEGIENSLQSEQLQELGCRLAQGFFFHKPVPPEVITSLLRLQAGKNPG